MTKIRITCAGVSMEAALNDSGSARAIAQALPIEGEVNRWGEEIYFRIPVSLVIEPDARDRMEVGELGYWPAGSAFCIFFGPTPASDGDQPVAASEVNVLGTVDGDAAEFAKCGNGESIKIEKA